MSASVATAKVTATQGVVCEYNGSIDLADVDEDGTSDLVFGNPWWGGDNRGGVFTYFGPVSGSMTDEDADIVIGGASTARSLGTSVAILHGDGGPAFLAGAGYQSDSGTSSGKAFLFDLD